MTGWLAVRKCLLSCEKVDPACFLELLSIPMSLELLRTPMRLHKRASKVRSNITVHIPAAGIGTKYVQGEAESVREGRGQVVECSSSQKTTTYGEDCKETNEQSWVASRQCMSSMQELRGEADW